MLLLALAAIVGAEHEASPPLTSTKPLAELRACADGVWNKGLTATKAFEEADRVTLEINMKKGFRLGSGDQAPWVLQISDEGAQRRVTMGYNHPTSEKNALSALRKFEKQCLAEAP